MAPAFHSVREGKCTAENERVPLTVPLSFTLRKRPHTSHFKWGGYWEFRFSHDMNAMVILAECEDPWTETCVCKKHGEERSEKYSPIYKSWLPHRRLSRHHVPLLIAEGNTGEKCPTSTPCHPRTACEETFSRISTAEFSVHKVSARFFLFCVRCGMLGFLRPS